MSPQRIPATILRVFLDVKRCWKDVVAKSFFGVQGSRSGEISSNSPSKTLTAHFLQNGIQVRLSKLKYLRLVNRSMHLTMGFHFSFLNSKACKWWLTKHFNHSVAEIILSAVTKSVMGLMATKESFGCACQLLFLFSRRRQLCGIPLLSLSS